MIQTDKIRARDSAGLSLFEDGGTGIFVKDGGNVGIGTDNPTFALHVLNANARIYLKGTNSYYAPSVLLENDRGSYNNYLHLLLGGSVDGGADLFGCDSVDLGMLYTDGIYNQGFILGNLKAKPLMFGTNNLVRVSIDGSGKVGIGTTLPTSNLHVIGLAVYANNAAAVAGGLTAGAFYRTGGDPDPVCVVH
jgi:hypothetical protein